MNKSLLAITFLLPGYVSFAQDTIVANLQRLTANRILRRAGSIGFNVDHKYDDLKGTVIKIPEKKYSAVAEK